MKKSPLPEGVVIKNEKDYQRGIVFRLLCDDCYHKCYICEHRPIPPEVEHRLTHKNDEALKYDWNNLLYSCVHCNRVKNNPKFYDGILNPIQIDPEEYINLYIEYNDDLKERIVVVKKVKDDDLVDITVELLDLVYNNISTDNRRESSFNLKNIISKDISMFMVYIEKYLEKPDDIIIFDVIKDEISRESEFAAFKRQIIRDNEKLFETFKEAL
jgi:hypothetical protein